MPEFKQSTPDQPEIESGNAEITETFFTNKVEEAVNFALEHGLTHASTNYYGKTDCQEILFFPNNRLNINEVSPINSPKIRTALLQIIKYKYGEDGKINIPGLFKVDETPGPVRGAEFKRKEGEKDVTLFIDVK